MKEIYWNDESTATPKPSSDIYREPSYVETVDNQIYFYSEVDSSSILQLNRRIRELDHRLAIEAAIQERESSPIILHIASYGGSLFSGLAGLDAIKQSVVPIVSVVDGYCASAATFLTIAGTKRRIGKYSFMLIHQLSAFSWGKYQELKDDQINFDRLMKIIKDIYLTYTKVPENKLDEILQHDLWFDAKTCLKYGLVDEII